MADEISQRLAFLRDKFSRKFLADGASITPKSLDRYITGEQRPGFDVLVGIAQSTGCDPGWLVLGRGEPFPAADPAAADRLNSVRHAWASTLNLLRAAAETQHALAPLISPNDAGPFDQIDETANRLAASLTDLAEFARLAHGRELSAFTEDDTVLDRRIAGIEPPPTEKSR